MRKMVNRTCKNCAKDFTTREHYVKRGNGRFCSKSCASSGVNNKSYRHGKTDTITYLVWAGVVRRIKNPHHKRYKNMYIDSRWYKFENFYEDMGERPSLAHSIDRVDNEDGYYKENCRWATKYEQMNNISTNRKLTLNGETHNQEEWGRITGFGGLTIHKRLKRGWSIQDALTKPLNCEQKHTRHLVYNGEDKTIRQWSEQFKISRETISYRLDRLGWSIEKALNTPKLR